MINTQVFVKLFLKRKFAAIFGGYVHGLYHREVAKFRLMYKIHNIFKYIFYH